MTNFIFAIKVLLIENILLCVFVFVWFTSDFLYQWTDLVSQTLLSIILTCPCNDDPLTPNFHVGKLGFIGLYIIFLLFSKTYIVGTR